MRVSEYYNLNRTQPSLDFVDIDIDGDLRVFLDPRALRLLPSEWGDECVSLVQNFFHAVLTAIHQNENERARSLLSQLREPNETHLGLSRNVARGRALGAQSAHNVWTALTQSEAVQSGLLEDLEDTILMVEGIASDIVSDITTNILRGPLIRYTHYVCSLYGISLVDDVDSGPLWDPSSLRWYSEYVSLPVANDKKLLFVPKAIIRRRMEYDVGEYFRNYILEHMQAQELAANTELVQLLKNGRRRVTKKALKEKYGEGKSLVVRQTLETPGLLARYRSDKELAPFRPLSHATLAEVQGTEPPNWNQLLTAVTDLSAGVSDSHRYEDAIEKLLSALFYPNLVNPTVQRTIHQGRKRIDISYTNMGLQGFFGWLARNYTAPNVFVECKNYSTEVGNPELDQLAGRFAPSRGKFGVLVCRTFQDKDLFIERCRDTALDQRGYIIPLDDFDLQAIVDMQQGEDKTRIFEFLKSRFDSVAM